MESRELRSGFTTGSCAAAAAKAACFMLLTGLRKDTVTILTPKGVPFEAKIEDTVTGEDFVRCAVRKDGGDDPDVTTGAMIRAEVTLTDGPGIAIEGGEGVGRVTRPGLDQPVGEAAINSVPRRMIREAVREVMQLCDYGGGIRVTVSVPGGEEIASHTFNPRLGIEGGISIIGTTGIVEPMSRKAIIDTIRVELKQKRAEGNRTAFVSPGNYGRAFMQETFGIELDQSVKCSNFIGETVDMVRELGFRELLLAGHSGKLVKIAGGIMNTHSREADCRMEILAAAAVKEGADTQEVLSILGSLTTEEAFAVMKRSGRLDRVCRRLTERITYYLDKRAEGSLRIGCILYSGESGILSATEEALRMIKENKEHWNG